MMKQKLFFFFSCLVMMPWLSQSSIAAVNDNTSCHVPFTMNTTEKMDQLIVKTSLQDASWSAENKRMEFAYKKMSQMSDERVFEVLFTGVPDSVVFGYGNNSGFSAANSRLVVEYATVGSNTYTELRTIAGKPEGTQFYNNALLPNVNRLRFKYKGVQNEGWVVNLTVTERKEMEVRTADDTIRFVARYNPDTTLYYDAEMDWYNLTPDLQYMSTSTTDGDLFGAKVEDIQVGLDQYGEKQKLQFFYKPARAGRQTSDVLVYSADITPTADMPASKLLARRVIEALTSFGADDVNFTHQTDTVEVAMGADTANLFMVLDKAGRAIESDSIFITYDYDTTQLAVDAEGKITPLCIGYHKVVAHLQGNMIIPELSDSLFIYVPQTGKNTVTWTIPETVFKGDTLIGIASYADSVGITYSAIPETAMAISGDTLVVKQAGLIQVVSYGDSSCYSRSTTDTISIRVKGVMTAEFTDLNWNNMMLDDQLNNIIVVKNDQDDTINDQVAIQLQLLPAEVGRVVGQTVMLDNSMDSVRIVATITHDTIRGVEISSPYFKVLPKSEKVTFENMEDTMLIGKTWDMLEHTTTRSGKQIDSIYVDPSTSALIENFSLTPSGRGQVTIYAISNGTTNYIGPDTASYTTRFVQGVLPIEWEKNLSLDSLHANDTLATSLVPVYDADTVDITSEVTKSYQLDQSGVAHVDELTGNIVIDQPTESLIIYVVTTGDNYQTRYDTIYCGVRTYEVDTLVYPNEPYRAGDVIAIADIAVMSTNQEDLTARVSLSFDFDDRTMAEVVGDSIVFNKSGLLDVYATIEGTGVATIVDTTTLQIGKCQIGEIIYPEEPIEQYYEGDTILVNQIIVKNPAGRDVTRLATVEWTVTPQGSAHVDSLGNLIFDKPGAISIQMLVTGDHLEDSTLTFAYTIRHDETNCLDLLVQVWEDVLAVDNKTNDINTFVRYEWYKDEAVLSGESNQDYHAPQGELLNGTYYVRAYDAQGTEYLICEKTILNQAPSAAMRQFVVYPSLVSNQESYVVETASNGEVTVTNSNGLLMERFAVEAGKTTVKSPMLQGVYMVHFVTAEGQIMMQKMIVK